MQFEGKHGYFDHELLNPQPFEVDVELVMNLQPAGIDDDLEKTVDYGAAFECCRAVVEGKPFHLLEGIAEAVASDLLKTFSPLESVTVRVRKPGVPIDGVLEYAGVEIERTR